MFFYTFKKIAKSDAGTLMADNGNCRGDDSDSIVYLKKRYGYVESPLDEIRIWVVVDAQHQFVLMLPSEY